MKATDKEILVNDVFEILSQYEDMNKNYIAKTTLVNELRRTRFKTRAKIENKWSLTAEFINYEMNDILKDAGFTLKFKNGTCKISV